MPVLSALVGQLALSIKGKVHSARAPIGQGEQRPSGSPSSQSDWLQRESVRGGDALHDKKASEVKRLEGFCLNMDSGAAERL